MKPTWLFATTLLAMQLSGCNVQSEVLTHVPVKPVKLLDVTEISQHDYRTFPATVHANKQAELSFRIPGELSALALMEGQLVNKGDVLAKLDDKDARNNVLNAEANYELAELDFKRKAKLFEQKMISKAEFDIAKATLKSYQATLNMMRDKVSYSTILAPFSGVVAKVYTDNFQMVNASQPILMLQDNELMEIKIQVAENILLKLNNSNLLNQLDASVRFGDQQTSQRYDILYKEHASIISKGSQAYEVTFKFLVPTKLNVLPGMSAEVNIDIAVFTKPKAVQATLPVTAILTRDNAESGQQSYVYRYNEDNQTLSLMSVELGNVTSSGIEVLSGLKQGDKIVANGVNVLKEGMQVKPLVWSRGV